MIGLLEAIQSVLFKMQRKIQQNRRPSNGKTYQTAPNGFFSTDANGNPSMFYSRIHNNETKGSFPFNQSSGVKYISNSNQNVVHFNPLIKTNSQLKVFPNTKKVYFTFIDPRSLLIEKKYIETIVHQPEKPYTNEWEQRYYELEKQMTCFMQSHERMAEEFLKIKEQLKFHNELTLQTSLQNFAKAHSLANNNLKETETLNMIQKYQSLKSKLEQQQREAHSFKQQNIRLQNMIEKLQSELISQKNLTYKTEIEKNQITIQAKQCQFEIKEFANEKARFQIEIYDLKLVLANKNLQIERLSSDFAKLEQDRKLLEIHIENQQEAKRERERQREKEKDKFNSKFQQAVQKMSSLPESMSQQRFEERLTRVRQQYERKQKKIEKQTEAKQKQINELRKYILELEEKERASKQFKTNYEKLYNEKKEEVNQLKRIQQTLMSSDLDERQVVVYEQRISELTKVVRDQEDKISTLLKNKKDMDKKIDQYQDNYVSQQQLAYLHSMIENNKDQLLEKGGVNYDELNNKAHSYFNGKIFEHQTIYQLKKDQERLLELIKKINLDEFIRPSNIVFSNTVNHYTFESGNDISRSMKNMISDIFFKLDRIAEGAKQRSHPNSDREILSSNSISPRRKRRLKNEENSVLFKIVNDLQILKVYIVDLSSTCDRLVKQLEKEQAMRHDQEMKHTETIKSQQQIITQLPSNEDQFYRLKNKQLQTRVQQLINLSNSLKEKLSEKHADNNSTQYWENEVNSIKQTYNELESRCEKLSAELEREIESKQEFEKKATLFSIELERRIQQNASLQSKLSLLSSVRQQNEEMSTRKASLERELAIFKSSNEEMKLKIQQYMKISNKNERQFGEMTSRIHELSAQKQALSNSQGENEKTRLILTKNIESMKSEVEKWKQKFESQTLDSLSYQSQLGERSNQLVQARRNNQGLVIQLRQLQIKNQEVRNQNQMMMEKYKSKITLLNQQNLKMKGQYDAEVNRHRQTEGQIMILKNQLQHLKKQSLVEKQQTTKSNCIKSNYFFTLQKLRSLILQMQTLTVELSLESTVRNNQIVQQSRLKYNKILAIIAELSSSGQKNQPGGSSQRATTDMQAKIEKMKSILLLNQFKLEFLRSLFSQMECLQIEAHGQATRDRVQKIHSQILKRIELGYQTIASFASSID